MYNAMKYILEDNFQRNPGIYFIETEELFDSVGNFYEDIPCTNWYQVNLFDYLEMKMIRVSEKDYFRLIYLQEKYKDSADKKELFDFMKNLN